MPRKTVVPDLDRFRPPGFDLPAYRDITREWRAQDWYPALQKRAQVNDALEAYAHTDRGLDAIDSWQYGRHSYTLQLCKQLLPEIFGSAERKIIREDLLRSLFVDLRPGYDGVVVKDLSIGESLHLYELLQGVPDFVHTHELMIDPDDVRGFFDASKVKGIIHPSLWDAPVRSLLEGGCSNLAWSYSVPLEVDLHAPDVEIVAAFTRWLVQARKTYGISQKRSDVGWKEVRPPVFDQASLGSWHSHNIIPFLDLYLWNRWHNPPPCPGLWSTLGDRFFFGGKTWTMVEETWLELLDWSNNRTYRRDVVNPGLKLLERESLRLLAVFAEKERAQSATPAQPGQDSS